MSERVRYNVKFRNFADDHGHEKSHLKLLEMLKNKKISLENTIWRLAIHLNVGYRYEKVQNIVKILNFTHEIFQILAKF